MASNSSARMRPIAPVRAVVTNERAIDGSSQYVVRLDLARDVQFAFRGPTGPSEVTSVTSDLLDIALAVCFVERDLRKLALTNRVKSIHIEVPVRTPSRWREKSHLLNELLGFMGGHEWCVSFSKSSLPIRNSEEALKTPKKQVVLHSGGMDSTCGLVSIRAQASETQLASFYTTQRSIQEEIARSLGFNPPSQVSAKWRDKKSRRGRSAFAYRSFLFLSIGSLVAHSFSARSLLQFENGFMAAAVPPSPNYFPTRHAHPRFHLLFNSLLSELGVDVVVDNPFRWKTKRQMVEECYLALGTPRAKRLLKLTQSCWFYNYHQFPSRFEREKIELPKHEHCGACVPCLVRRVAFRDQAYTLDPRQPPKGLKNSANVSHHFDAYAAFCRLVLQNRNSPGDVRRALLRHGIVIDGDPAEWPRLHALIVQFSEEFFEAFGKKYA